MSWVVYIFFLLLIGYTIYRHRFFHLPGLMRSTSVWFFILKIIAAIGVWYVYTIYYPQREYADIWKYYDDSEVVYNSLDSTTGDYFRLMTGIGIDDRIQHEYIDKMMHWDQKFESNLFNDSHTIIRFNALMRLVSLGNYHTHSLFMCLLGFIGLCALYRWIYPFLYQWKKILAFILFISPSLLFWTSGVLKEGILFFGIGMLILQAWKFTDDKKPSRLLWSAIALALIAITKLYVIVFVVPPLLLGLSLKKRPRFAFLKTTALFALLIITSFVLDKISPRFSPFLIIAAKQRDFHALAKGGVYIMNNQYVCQVEPEVKNRFEWMDAKHFHLPAGQTYYYWSIQDDFKDTLFGTIHTDSTVFTILSESPPAASLMHGWILQPTARSVYGHVPSALARSIFRPWPWEIKPLIIVPPMLENLLMYLLFVAMLLAWRKPANKAVFWFCISYALITLAVTGLTTPVLGALVRYRITALPFLLFALLMCINREILVKRLPFLGRII